MHIRPSPTVTKIDRRGPYPGLSVAPTSATLLLASLPLLACSGPQSALDPGGVDAERLGTLFWVMVGAAALIWLALMTIAVIAVLGRPGKRTRPAANALIIGGGVVFPTLGLAVLLTFGLSYLPDWRDSPASLRIHVHGEQFWWRVVYERDGERVVSANEIHMPAGESVEFVLTSADVIHSFWIPPLGGKMDMIPGRTNRLILTGTRPGSYRGACAEFCGASHALMAFAAEVQAPKDFDAWLAAQAQPARTVDEPQRGRELFLSSGCGACHRVRGLVELGAVGPDLTHFGSRRTLAAGIAENTPEALARWIANPAAMKPGVEMPGYAMLPEDEIAAIAAFLGTLK